MVEWESRVFKCFIQLINQQKPEKDSKMCKKIKIRSYPLKEINVVLIFALILVEMMSPAFPDFGLLF